MTLGVPTGYTHNWAYKGHWKEKKVAPGKWKVTFSATKGRKAKTYGPIKKGTTIKWKFKNVKQTARKTSKGTYQTKLTGIKYLAKIRRKRKW